MKIFVERIIIKNRAPFESLDLAFNENEIAVLTAVNGRGKTTILSYIVDAWYEMVRPHFRNEFKGKENEYYRISSSILNMNQNAPSFVYIRFETLTQISQEEYNKENNKHISETAHGQTFFYIKDFIDYVDVRNKCSNEEYENAVILEKKIPYASFQNALKKSDCVKKVSDNFKKEIVDKTFQNIITSFPAYRYEMPGYLNDPYKIHLDFTKEPSFSGYLTNPLEVVSGLPQLANWIMDVVLDMDLYKQTETFSLPTGGQQTFDMTPERIILWENLNNIMRRTLISKNYQGTLRFGIGKRNSGGARISIMNDWKQDNQSKSQQFYPTIFNLSSGETAMLCLFGEILRQADQIQNNISLEQIRGIVLIDEVDKHLHIKLQKEVLPLLFNLFPNVQFIVSSHSPFLNMGLAENSKSRTKIIDLDNFGISTDPTINELYKDVYNMMINENNRFAEMYNNLSTQIQQSTKPLIITEGKTDIKHLKKAKEKLNILGCDVEFYEITEDWGDSKLRSLLEQLSKVKRNRKIIGIFDRDVKSIITDIEKGNQSCKNYGNNVYAFCIPIPNGRENYTNISIEFYYADKEIKKEKDGRSLYFDNEIENLYNKTKNKPEYRKLDTPDTQKEESKKIFDEDKMCEVTEWIHSKNNFATLVETDEEFAKDFDFSKFNLIFDKIKEIIIL